MTITDEQGHQFKEEGYFLLPDVIPANDLEALCAVCGAEIARMDAEMDAAGVTVSGISHKSSRYFIPFASRASEAQRHFVFGDILADVCRATIGDEAYLFLDQYVVKAAETGMAFGWHQDGGYIGYPHTPYLSCWCTLDAVDETNGTVYILPFSRAGSREYTKHVKDPATNDMVGYFGDDPGIPVILPAGSIAVFGSNVFHRSGANQTDAYRRILLAQYTPQPIWNEAKQALHLMAEPFLKDGVNVAQSGMTGA